jgi:hypothetical protein
MKKFYSVFILATFVALFATFGCTPTTQNTIVRDATVTANSAAMTLEVIQGTALIIYRTEQELQLITAKDAGETKEQAIARVKVVRAAWKPVWESFEMCRNAYSLLADVLSAKEPTPAAVQTAVNHVQDTLGSARIQLSVARSRVQGGVQ